MTERGDLVLGADVGTGSTKVVVTGLDGAIVAEVSQPHSVALPFPGHVEQDATEQWWGEVAALCVALPGEVRRRVGAVAVSGLGPCVLVGDEAGRPLRAAILYGVDTRATAEIAELRASLGDEAIAARCGSVLSTQAAGPKLAWLARHEPERFARARTVFTASSFLVHRLTGEYVLDHHTASQYDPLYDLDTNEWVSEWWDAIAGRIRPPRLAWSGEVVGQVHAGAAAATGLPEGIPVTAGTVDAWAEAYSVGVERPGEVMVMYGSTMFLVAPTARRGDHPALWSTVGLFPGSRCLAAGMATSGSLTTWWRDVTGGELAALFDEAAASPPGANQLLALPYFAGERTPIADPLAVGMLCGLTLEHARGDVMRALLEATAYGVRHNLDAFAAAGAPAARLVAVGGGVRGTLWTQIVSDVTGMPQTIPTVTVGAAYGDARLAASALGVDTTGWVDDARRCDPDRAAAAVYAEGWEDYLELYLRCRPVMHRLSARRRAAARIEGR